MGITTMNTGTQPRHSDPVAEDTTRVEYWARQVSACALIEDLADWYGVPSDTVWHCLQDIADDQLHMLDRPDGWWALGQLVGARLDIRAPEYRPQVH